jgi:hypothetical protein
MRSLGLSAFACLLLPGPGPRAQQYEWRTASAFSNASLGLAYDTRQKRMVMVRGTETWECDGAVWRRLATGNPMGALTGPSLAFDRARGVTVLFGGTGTGGLSALTWTWNGTAWTRLFPATSPPARWSAPMVYDVARQRLVLYGGDTSGGSRNDTWEFDGTNWSQRFPVRTPTAQAFHRMAYDEARGVAVLFGGLDGSRTLQLAETWEWNGLDWTQRQPVRSPPARRNHGMAYDPHRARTVVFGGFDNNNLRDTWEWDGVNWTPVATGPDVPPGETTQVIAADEARGGCVLVEPRLGGSPTWSFDGTSWRVAIPAESPELRDDHALGHDPVRGETLLFGTRFVFTLPGASGTWLHRCGSWLRMSPATSPPDTQQPALAHDPAAGGILMFGGFVAVPAPGPSAATWRWTGSDWQSLQPGASPPARTAAAMAADPGRGRVVLFGGDGGAGPLGDTWEWDGARWLQQAPVQSPPPRESHAMAYDPRRARTVLFGGGDAMAPPTLGDHWEWDGANWTQIAGVPLPPARTSHGLVFDTASQKVLLIGGQFLIAAALGQPRNDLWEWDGAAWVQRFAPAPGPLGIAVAAHDPSIGRTMLYGGSTYTDTWQLGPVSPAQVAGFGSGCPGSFGLPQQRTLGLPFAGNRFFAVQASALPPGAFALLGLATLSANQPLPGGCTALIGQPVWLGGVADARGSLVVPLPIPALPSLRGMQLSAQSVVVDPNGALLGLLALSAGLRVTIG